LKKHTKKGKEYTPVVQAELDLHGYTTQEAKEAVEEFMSDARARQMTRVRIIVGKGTRSPGGVPVLPNAVKTHLNHLGYTYTYAKIQNGGEGALEIPL
jgi:DNA-nicking Smr family endonuclease